jgi:hypothetical protein
MTFFDDLPRTDLLPPHQDEPEFAYLKRSARPEAARMRQMLDTWLENYPQGERLGLVER